ncbi:hypothetical protein [Pseudonocardia acaciae]|uniref:hypothetical protein n=1 Tax=Pseudonocardia acaciae TaxID=551276 RepID=UPI000567587B|nr:hypothetical protein [Pseudonocardia acaciae]
MGLTWAHWIYLAGIALLIGLVLFKKNVVGPAIVATFLTAAVATGSAVTGIGAVFRAAIAATTELLPIFLIIAIMTSLMRALRAAGADERMVLPFQRLMRGGRTAYLVLAALTFALSLVFWPTPVLPLLAAILVPAALRAGLSPMGAAVAIAVAGQGMALSSDYILGVAPGLSARGAGVPAGVIADRAMVISLVVGAVALGAAYALTVRRTLVRDAQRAPEVPVAASPGSGGGDLGDLGDDPPISGRRSRALAVAVPGCFGALLAFILLGRFTSLVPRLDDGAAAPLVGGTAALLLVATAAVTNRSDWHERACEHFVDGTSFAFRVMGMVIPVAGFIYVGLDDFSGKILDLPEGPHLLRDAVAVVSSGIPHDRLVAPFVMLVVGMILGLDGNGWPGLPFTGTLAAALGGASGADPATLAAVAQNGATWVGGGTLVVWSTLIAVAGITGVSVIDLARRLFVPVVAGLLVATTAAAVLW